MTIDDWRKNKTLRRWWASVLATDEGRAFLEMMERSHIRHTHNRGLDAGIELGQIQGYDIAVNNVIGAGLEIDQLADPGEPTYEPPELEPAPKSRKRV